MAVAFYTSFVALCIATAVVRADKSHIAELETENAQFDQMIARGGDLADAVQDAVVAREFSEDPLDDLDAALDIYKREVMYA